MYKVPSRDNKIIFRLQDFTKNDNVDETFFVEGENSQGKKRLQCQVHVLHTEELEAIQQEQDVMKARVEELQTQIMQKNVEIKKLEREVAKHKRANIDERAQLRDDKFNMLLDRQKALDELNETHANQLIAIDETHRKHLDKISAQYNAKLDKADEKLDNEVQANKQASDNLRDKMLAMKETHKNEVVALQKQHHKELDKLQHAHSDELQAQRDQHQDDIDTLKQNIADIKQEHIVEVNEIEKRHRDEVDEIRKTFLKMLASEHAQDLSDFNECGELPFYVKPFSKRFINAFDEFKKRKETNTPQKIVETYELAPAQDE